MIEPAPDMAATINTTLQDFWSVQVSSFSRLWKHKSQKFYVTIFRQEVANIFIEYEPLVKVNRDKKRFRSLGANLMATEAQVMLIHNMRKDSLHWENKMKSISYFNRGLDTYVCDFGIRDMYFNKYATNIFVPTQTAHWGIWATKQNESIPTAS